MFDVRKPKQKPIVVIRAASAAELSEYEKEKLASIQANAEENLINIISLDIDGNKQSIQPIDKEVTIDLGSLALQSSITPDDISQDDCFIIKCELDEDMLNEQD